MEKEKDVCALSKNRYIFYWKMLLLNYNQKNTHIMQQKCNLYYSVFKDISEKDFKTAIKRTIQNQQYFPNVSEIYKYLPSKEEKIEQKLKYWENIKKEEITEEEEQELKELLKEFN